MGINKEKNYKTFKEILGTVERDGIKDLITWLDTTDFKDAPASTKYHSNVDGGLCQHSLNVYYNLKELNKYYEVGLSEDSMKIVALLHDISKTEFYEKYIQNRKEYGSGTQRDDNGVFHWIQVSAYKIKDDAFKGFVCADHGTNSYLIINKYLNLNEEETAAVINHHMDLDKSGIIRTDISEIYNRYPLASFLHLADLIATYWDENPYAVDEQSY